MNTCPSCQASERQVKVGRNHGGSQRYSCRLCQRYYTLQPSVNGYDETIRRQAVKLYIEGTNFRRIGRLLSVNHQSVVNWVNAYHARLPVNTKQHRPVLATSLHTIGQAGTRQTILL